MVMTTATDDTRTSTVMEIVSQYLIPVRFEIMTWLCLPALHTKNHLSLCGGISSTGNCMSQNNRWLTICCDVMPMLEGM